MSELTKSRQPLDIVKAFMAVYPFKTLYVADLNAIQSIENTGRHHQEILKDIKHHFPHLTIWVDAGINAVEKANQWVSLGAQVVLGSESFQTIEQYSLISKHLNNAFTLSLDFLAKGYAGPDTLLRQSQFWPKEVIMMTLAKVGENSGVDINTIKRIMQNNQQLHFYAAGGVRHFDDLSQLSALNVKGALIASALHNKRVSTRDLEKLNP